MKGSSGDLMRVKVQFRCLREETHPAEQNTTSQKFQHIVTFTSSRVEEKQREDKLFYPQVEYEGRFLWRETSVNITRTMNRRQLQSLIRHLAA